MKNFLIVTVIATLVMSSCKTSQLISYADDVYANPTEERKLKQLAAVEKAKSEALEKQKIAEERAAQKAKDDANPYYKDPNYNRDDYYDYQYASRVNRFQNPVMGASYYDPYYTNLYTYNQNPNCFGTSIYSTYNYGMPSSTFNNYSMGISTGWGYNNGFNNSFGYNSGFGCNSGFNNFYSDPFYGGYGYNNYGFNNNWNNNWAYSNGYNNAYYMGYANGFNNAQWGYYNSLDPNSAYSQVHYGPRGSSGGGNSDTRTAARMAVPEEGAHQKYMQSVAEQQNNAPRFTNSSNNRVNTGARNSNGGYSQGGYAPSNSETNSSNTNSGRISNNGRNSPVMSTDPGTNSGARTNDRVENQPKRSEIRLEQNNNSQNKSTDTWNNNSNSGGSRSNSDGGSSPRNSGGGGNSRPR